MPKKGSRKIGDRWWTEEELLQAGRELAELFRKANPDDTPESREG